MNEKKLLLIAILLATLMRLLLLQQYIDKNPFYDHPILDSAVYLDWAEAIMEKVSYFTEEYHHPPGYAFFLSLLMEISAGNHYVVLFAQSLMVSLQSALVFLLTRSLLLRSASAWIAFSLFSLSGPVVFYSMKILSETLYCTLLLMCFFFLMRYVLRAKGSFLFWTGMFLGMAIEVRGNAAVCAIPCMAAILRNETRWKTRFTVLSLFLAGISVCVLPVLFRNVAVAGAWTPVASNWGENFYFANNESATGTFAPAPEMGRDLKAQIRNVQMEASRRLGRKLSSLEAQRFWFREGLHFLITQPGKWQKLEIVKIHRLFSRQEASTMYFYDLESHYFQPVMRCLFAGWGVVLPLFLLGTFAVNKEYLLSLVFLFVLLQALLLLIFWPELRFELPLIPFLCIVTGNIVNLRWSSLRFRAPQMVPFGLLFIWIISNLIPLRGTGGREAWFANASAALFARGDYGEAIAMAKRAAQLNPGHVDAWINLGAGLYHLGRKAEARQAWQTALRVNPDSFAALRNMAVSYETEDPSVASAWWQKALLAARAHGFSEKELEGIQEKAEFP